MIDIAKVVKKTYDVLDEERQSLWTILRLSISQQLDYWLQLCYPSNIKAAANKMDSLMWEMLERTADSKIPRLQGDHHQEETTVICVPGIKEKSYQEWVIRQSIRLGGFGLRCQSNLSPAAFVGAVEQVLPSFVGAKAICPQLAHLLGSMDDPQQRWQILLASGCRTGQELREAWDTLQKEAKAMSEFLGANLEEPLCTPTEGLGEGSLDGTTRKRILEQMEMLKGSVLTKALQHHPNQMARPVKVWPQIDKLSSSWLLSLPGPHSGLTSSIFSESVCANLFLPSPPCRDFIGERVGRSIVDMYGERVMAAQLPGDTWRIRQDMV